MKKRTFLKLAAASLTTLVSTTVLAQEKRVTITVDRKKYYVYPNRKNNRIEDEKGKDPGQKLASKIIRTYLINQRLQNYLPTVEQNLRRLNRTIDRSRIAEVKRKCREISGTAIDDIISSIKNPPKPTLSSIMQGCGENGLQESRFQPY